MSATRRNWNMGRDVSFKEGATSSANTVGRLFADFINPEFTYKYANTTIDHGNKKVTIKFDVTDKYFKETSLSTDTAASKIAVEVDGKTTTNATKKLTKLSDKTATIDGKANTKIGETYELEVTGLDQGGGGDYSGIMKLTFDAGIITDKSGNSNISKTITVGIDDPDTGEGDNSGVIVDVVSPVWKAEVSSIDRTNSKVRVSLIATDKYLTGVENSTLTIDDITLTVDGDSNANTIIKKELSTPTFSTNATTGMKEIKYTLTLSNWEEATKQTGKSFLEYSGNTKITIAAGTIRDDSNEYVKPSAIYDESGNNADGLHIGDFINYDAGTWTAAEISAIQTGLKTNLQTANGTASLPANGYQFGGFTAGSSRNGNATPYVSIQM